MLVFFYFLKYRFFFKIFFLHFFFFFGVLGIAGGLSICPEAKWACWTIWHQHMAMCYQWEQQEVPFPTDKAQPWTEWEMGLIGI